MGRKKAPEGTSMHDQFTRWQIYVKKEHHYMFDRIAAFKGVTRTALVNVLLSDWLVEECRKMEDGEKFESFLRKAMLDTKKKNLTPPKLSNLLPGRNYTKKSVPLEEEPKETQKSNDWRDEWEI